MVNISTHIVVLLREVCDPAPPARLTADGFSVRQRGLRYIANPSDLSGLEQALQLAETIQGTVTAITVGPKRNDDLLRLSLSMGAGRAIRVNGPGSQEWDVLAHSRLLERVLDILKPDFFITGSRLIDRGNDPVPALSSAQLGIPCITKVLQVKTDSNTIEALRKCDRGARQKVETSSPCALLFDEGCCEPHYPDQAAIMSAIEMEVETWSEADLGLSFLEIGERGSALTKARCSFPRSHPRRIVTPDAQLPAFDRILALLSGGIKPRAGIKHELSAEQTIEMLINIFQEEGLLNESEA